MTRMKYGADYTGWPGQAWAWGHVSLMSVVSCLETFMVLSAPLFDLAWSSCSHSHNMSNTPTCPSLFVYSFNLHLGKQLRECPSWYTQQALEVESSNRFLWVMSLSCARLNIGLWTKGAAKNLPIKTRRSGSRHPSFTCCGFSHLDSCLHTCVHSLGRWPVYSTGSSGIHN